MFNKKNKFRIGFYLGIISLVFINFSICSATSFSERLAEIGLDIPTFSKKTSISRYEITRLLNAVNCEDCVQAPLWMQNTYTSNFWNSFKAIDGKDFNDINFLGGVWNKKSYFYCVAYVGENGLMSGYPSTSTKCQGNFCGQESITISEFYQIVLNIIQDQIREKYQIDWSQVKSRLKGLKKDSTQMRVLNETNILAINNADSKSNYAKNNDEFQAWLKYCMYNLSACNFRNFGVIGTGYWPVAELNVLYKEGIITESDAENVAKFTNLNGEEAIRIFENVHDSYKQCSFDTDYDCDGITNGQDNCPYTFNRNQFDLDGDGIGNVCDDDIDGDGKKNPIGIVDDNNNIIISIWDDKQDGTPLGDADLGYTFFINVDSINDKTVTLSPVADGNITKVERNFGDGNKQIANSLGKISHTFKSAGTYTVNAIATSDQGHKAFATTKVFLAVPQSELYALNISPKFSYKNGSIEYTFSPMYSGDINIIARNINGGQTIKQKAKDSFKTTISENGTYTITAKGYKNDELKAVAVLSFKQDNQTSFASMNIKAGSLRDNAILTTNPVGILKANINNIQINRGDGSSNSNSWTQSHSYSNPGVKTIQQNVILKDGTVLSAIATVTVQNPLLSQSYAVNFGGKALSYNQNEKLSLGLKVFPNGLNPLSLFTSYQAGQKLYQEHPDFSKSVINFTYDTAGDKSLVNNVEINQCIDLSNQGTFHVKGQDFCLNALKNKELSKYKCDMDLDGIPDICDDDIDGDGKKNLIGLIIVENADCSINSKNVNITLLQKQLGVCSLDNCPFTSNVDQSDLNNNGVGDACDSVINEILNNGKIIDSDNINKILDADRDFDGIPDIDDECPTIPGNSSNGCPKLYSQSCDFYAICGNGVIDEGETCLNCPQDVGECCGNGVKDLRENCLSCPIDAGECGSFCGDGIVDNIEDCSNCEKDVNTCTAFCGNGKIDAGETCYNCPQDVKLCKNETCGNGKIEKEAGEECDNGKNNGKDKKCTLECTIYNPDLPNCGNGNIDEGEDCKNCPVDLKDKCVIPDDELCGNGKIDKGEDCKNCPQDVGKCTAFCGNGIIEDAEDCLNCPEDVGECTAFCGNGKVEKAETCENCNADVKQCKSSTCGNGKIEKEAGEECDNGKDNGKDGTCTLECTIVKPNNPNCGNGVIDKGEDCETCPVDLGDKCIKPDEHSKCGDGKIDEGENCLNCPKDVGECTAFCGNGIIEEAEDCLNCPKDAGECTAFCGNGKIEEAETCKNCNADVKQCKSSTCGNGKIEKEAGEECDNGKNNGKDKQCTEMCTKYNPNNPNCGNGIIDKGEDCETCPVDLGDKCIKPDENSKCGDGKIDEGENCLNCPQDVGKCTAFCGNGIIEDAEDCLNCPKDVGECTAFCGNGIIEEAEDCLNCPKDVGECTAFCGNGKIEEAETCKNCNADVKQCKSSTCGNGKIEKEAGEECDNGSQNGKDKQCTEMCTKYNPNNPNCGNGIIDKGEDCKTCSVDLGDKCVKPDENCGNGIIDDGEDCESCPIDLKERCIVPDDKCGNGVIDKGEDCESCPIDLKERCIVPDNKCGNDVIDEGETCENCQGDLKDICIDDGREEPEPTPPVNPDPPINLCGNGKIDEGETCETCPEDLGRCIQNKNCNSCPCEYADMASQLSKGDTVRAKLWDKNRAVLYKYSKGVSVNSLF